MQFRQESTDGGRRTRKNKMTIQKFSIKVGKGINVKER